MDEFERCLGDGRLQRFDASPAMVSKEIETAIYDITRAVDSLSRDDNKWASVQAYYCMFHAAKALVLSRGYRERSHHCLLIALRTLWVETEELAASHVLNLALCMDIRHEADYGHTFSHDSAMEAIRMAREMLEASRSLLGL